LIYKKKKLDGLSEKFSEMKFLTIQYKESKDVEINSLNSEIDKFKLMIEEANKQYELVLDKTTNSLQEIIKNTETKSELQ